ncbi:hypothetical protein [Halococcus qingdaonensis]|uniref:hypothetical protein n=1 Tax=Halococcus qingdaonensis TaxID=224402 RepID=UPI002116443B|nr:hypothetical protein [Halococcus qingdaonensis]
MVTPQTIENDVEQLPTDNRILDLDSSGPVALPSATVIFVDSYRRTDGEAVRYDGDVPTHIVRIYSECDVRKVLAGIHMINEIDQAIDRGERMPQDNATEAVSYAKRRKGMATNSNENTSTTKDTDPAVSDIRTPL